MNTFIHLSHTLSYHFVFLKYLIAPDILSKKLKKESHHYMNQTNKKYYD